MITKEQAMLLLLQDCPSFLEKWEAHRAFYAEEHLLYNDFGEFAHHLVELHKQNQTHEFIAVFATIERLHKEGDEFVKEAATIGLLEGIQNLAGDQATKFERYLGSESERWWKKLNDFWDGKQKIE